MQGNKRKNQIFVLFAKLSWQNGVLGFTNATDEIRRIGQNVG